jgi:hypothetical protein
MSNFCVQCGSQLTAGAQFCRGCGRPLSAPAPEVAAVAPAPAVPVTPAPPVPAQAAPRSSPLLKIVIVLFGIVCLLGAMTVAGLVYAGYKVKNKVEQAAKEYGIDSADRPSARRVDVCSLLTKDEASRIIGTQIERVEREGDKACTYYGQAPTQAEREQQFEQAQRQLDKDRGNGANSKGIEQVTKTLLSGMAGGVGPSFSITVDWENGRTMLGAMKFVLNTADPGTKHAEPLTGIGDEAVLGPVSSMLVFVKGSTGVQIDLRMLPNGREKGTEIARIVARRLVVR